MIDEVQKIENWSEVVKREWDADSRNHEGAHNESNFLIIVQNPSTAGAKGYGKKVECLRRVKTLCYGI